jgi:rRNA maturation endonuclease Nob1
MKNLKIVKGISTRINIIKEVIREYKIYKKHICAICGKKILPDEEYLESMGTWEMVHKSCFEREKLK